MFDLPMIGRCRRDLLALDSIRFLTRGNPLGIATLFEPLISRHLTYTAIGADGSTSIMGQITKKYAEAFARLSFLAPHKDLGGAELHLLDHLSKQAGTWGAHYILGETDERSDTFKSLRKSGYAMYAWQKIWRLKDSSTNNNTLDWRVPSAADMPVVAGLYAKIVPLLIQPFIPLPQDPKGMICYQAEKLQAYVDLTYGPRGIWAQPLVNPDAEFLTDLICTLLLNLPRRGGRAVYLCLQSSQAWLEPALEESGAEASPRQAVMVKHLTAAQRDEVKITVRDKALAKPAATVVRASTKNQGTGSLNSAQREPK